MLRFNRACLNNAARHSSAQLRRLLLVSGSAMSTSTPTPQRVLVIDDNHDAAEMLCNLIAILGHETRYALGGPEGIDQAALFKPDVIFLDIGMPGMNGFETCIGLRTLPGLDATCIVALTAWTDPATRLKCEQCGFNFHLAKPASIDLIESVILQAAAAHRSSPRP